MSGPILAVEDLARYFPVRSPFGVAIGALRALDGVSFSVEAGETLGIVGESGCGKSTLGKTLAGIHRASGGRALFESENLVGLDPAGRRRIASRLQYVHQDPGNSLDPRWSIRRSLHEPLIVHTTLDAAGREARVREILAAVGMPETHLDLYPHELSGGQQRRIGLARVLTLQPRLVVLDEPTSGLDVSVQATVLKLFRSLQERFALTYLFISHDLSVVRIMCDRIAVMYLGRIVEIGKTEALFSAPRHPYTRSLLAAIPRISGRRITEDFVLEGEPPDPSALPTGCRFRTRCPLAAAPCAETEPSLVGSHDGHRVACHFA